VSAQANGIIPPRVDQDVVLRAVSGSINRARTRPGAPYFRLPMTGVGDRSRPLDRPHRPQPRKQQLVQPLPDAAFCHSSRRREQVTPEPKPSSAGRCVHEIPVCSTNRIRYNASRSGSRLRPGSERPLLHRQQQLDQLPQIVRDDPQPNGHRHPPQPDDGCRPQFVVTGRVTSLRKRLWSARCATSYIVRLRCQDSELSCLAGHGREPAAVRTYFGSVSPALRTDTGQLYVFCS
jgi:hypothetical protein